MAAARTPATVDPGPAAEPRVHFASLLACFFLSGCSSLIFEVVWTKQLGFVFGTTEIAVAAVLAGFLGGLGVGAAVAGRAARTVRRPALVYAALELAVAAGSLAVPMALRGATLLYVRWFGSGGPAASPSLRLGFYLVAALLVVGVPAACMGATLPMLARHSVRAAEQTGLRVGLLYAVNTVGGVAGAALAGFALVPRLGLTGASWVAVAASALAAGAAARIGVRSAAPTARHEPAGPDEAPSRLIALVVLASGAVALLYEIFWTRLLSHLLGSSLYAFSTMLAIFLLGIAGGAALAAAASRDRRRAGLGLVLCQVGAGVLSLASFVAVEQLASAMATGSAAPAPLARQAGLAAAALLPGALCLGASLPLAVRLATGSAAEAGPVSGRLYAWNTAGAILGSVATGLSLLPALGFPGTLKLAAAINLLLAALSALAIRPRRGRTALAAGALLVALIAMPLPTPWAVLGSSALGGARLAGEPPRFFAVGRSATVLLRDLEGEWALYTNGLPEGSIQPPGVPAARYLITRWMGALPGLLRPSPRSVLVVGLGSGTLLEEIPPSVVDLAVVEIEPEVVRANQAVAQERRHDPLAEARTRLVPGDARNTLLLDRRRYDAILSQPSHPWASGAAPLYTQEFFELVARRLAPDGVFVQWMGLPFVDEELLRGLVASLLSSFEHLHAFRPPAGAGLLFVASQSPLDPTRWPADRPPTTWSARLGLARPEDLAATWVLDTAGARRLAAGARPITDDANRLETRAPRVLGHGLERDLGERVLAPLDPLLSSPPAHLDSGYLARRLFAAGPPARARRFAEALPGREERQLATGLLGLATGESEHGALLLLDVLARRPGSAEARAGLLRAGVDAARLPPLSPLETAFVEARRRESGGRSAAVRELDGALAAAAPGDPLFPPVARLRAAWRLALADAGLAGEAVEWLDLALAFEPSAGLLLLRAQATRLMGDARGTLASLSDLGRAIGRRPLPAAQREVVLGLLDGLPEGSVPSTWRAEVRERLRRGGS